MVKSKLFQKCEAESSWTQDNWGRNAKYICAVHKVEIWEDWLWWFHINWWIFADPPFSIKRGLLEYCSMTISEISAFSKRNQLAKKFDGFKESLDQLKSAHNNIISKCQLK